MWKMITFSCQNMTIYTIVISLNNFLLIVHLIFSGCPGSWNRTSWKICLAFHNFGSMFCGKALRWPMPQWTYFTWILHIHIPAKNMAQAIGTSWASKSHMGSDIHQVRVSCSQLLPLHGYKRSQVVSFISNDWPIMHCPVTSILPPPRLLSYLFICLVLAGSTYCMVKYAYAPSNNCSIDRLRRGLLFPVLAGRQTKESMSQGLPWWLWGFGRYNGVSKEAQNKALWSGFDQAYQAYPAQ